MGQTTDDSGRVVDFDAEVERLGAGFRANVDALVGDLLGSAGVFWRRLQSDVVCLTGGGDDCPLCNVTLCALLLLDGCRPAVPRCSVSSPPLSVPSLLRQPPCDAEPGSVAGARRRTGAGHHRPLQSPAARLLCLCRYLTVSWVFATDRKSTASTLLLIFLEYGPALTPPPPHAHAHCAVVVVLCVPGLSTAVRLAALGVVAASLGLTAYIVLVHLGALEAEWGIDGASAARRRASELRARCPDILPLVRYDGREGSYHRSSVAMDTLRSYPVRTTKLSKGVACA